MTTFSQLVDSILVETRRPELLESMAMYANQSIRKVHTKPSGGSVVLFDENRYEEEYLALGAAPYLWPISAATRFQRLEAVYSVKQQMYLEGKAPTVNRRVSNNPFADLFWYRTGSNIALSGIREGDTLKLSYHLYPRRLTYMPPGTRPVEYDAGTDTYVTPGGAAPTEEQMDSVTNWVLQRWQGVIEQGVRSAVFRGIGDFDRSRVAYSAFEDDRLQLWQSEPNTSISS